LKRREMEKSCTQIAEEKKKSEALDERAELI
jgi:hypothetical protein